MILYIKAELRLQFKNVIVFIFALWNKVHFVEVNVFFICFIFALRGFSLGGGEKGIKGEKRSFPVLRGWHFLSFLEGWNRRGRGQEVSLYLGGGKGIEEEGDKITEAEKKGR